MGDRDAVEIAVRALRTRDRTVAELEARLAERGVGDADRTDAIETLVRAGFLDDRRVAAARAAVLAERGAGDAFIRADLSERGVGAELVDEALGALEDESVRAERVLARRGRSPKTMRYLASRGFDEETIAELIARTAGGTIG